ncbi:unnamed protein product [Chondrus crispus]|uniref:Uncharacterized protein n=1 Tax=Chondrus crispus TaxID=2769 RepID=R7QLS3_CHOCR|nr:unnamed protein product [Chondrus crispus]CDF38345.1 unnamed protein product [Chondrus crispus]|eukprot:XP_005718230.1 unnamed protein product [Chondrus crispus]
MVRLPVPGPTSKTVSVRLTPALATIALTTIGLRRICWPWTFLKSMPRCPRTDFELFSFRRRLTILPIIASRTTRLPDSYTGLRLSQALSLAATAGKVGNRNNRCRSYALVLHATAVGASEVWCRSGAV